MPKRSSKRKAPSKPLYVGPPLKELVLLALGPAMGLGLFLWFVLSNTAKAVHFMIFKVPTSAKGKQRPKRSKAK